MKILITGCHGDIGLSLLKILRSEYKNLIALGADATEDGPGKIYFDSTHVLPRVSEPNYLQALENLLSGVDLIVPASEPELRFFGSREITTVKGVKLIMANFFAQKVGFDKWETFEFLRNSSLPFIQTVRGKEVPNFPYPVIYKPRAGAGSRGIQILRDETDLKKITDRSDDYIIQEYVSDENQEYTCCLFSDGKEVRSIIVKRTMRYGLTLTAEPVENKSIDEVLRKLASAIRLTGSINVQLRLDQSGVPKIFEINPRFSSTVYFRHAIGFKDLVWSLQAAQDKTTDPYTGYQRKKLYRHFADGLLDY